MPLLNNTDLAKLDIAYEGQPFVQVEPHSLFSTSLDIVYLGAPFVAVQPVATPGLNAYVRVGGSWKRASAMYIRTNGVWTATTTASTRISGVWKAVANGYDTDAQTYITAVETVDGEPLETAVRNAINAFVVGCKEDGIWTSIKACCILAGARTLAGALVPLVGTAPTNNNFVSADYNRKTGLLGDGSTKNILTNRNSNADPQDSHHLSIYATAPGQDGAKIHIGAGTSQSGATNIGRYSGNSSLQTRSRCSALTASAGSGMATGLIALNRASSVNYQRRVAGAETTATQASQAPLDQIIQVFSSQSSSYSSARIAFYSIGESLSLALLEARVTALISACSGAIP
jgi:hypothetical protein